MANKKPMGALNEEKLNEGWIWIMQIIFGVIATAGFTQLVQTLPGAFELSLFSGLFNTFIALGAMIFLLYDLTAFQALTQIYPYTINPYSYYRFLLDVIMAFLLALILFRLTELKSYEYTRQIGITLIAWHVLAIAWHHLALLEYQRPPNNTELRAGKIHAVIIFLYILVLVGPCEIVKTCAWDMERVGQRIVHVLLVSILIVASTWRSYRIRKRLHASD